MSCELSKIEIYLLVRNWFKQLNEHAPIENLLNMLSEDGFEMKFPEAVISSKEQFEKWYVSVTNTFFDQIHDVKNIEINLDGNIADIMIYVNWKARTWKAPDGYSSKIDSDAFQVWKVVYDVSSGVWKIKYYAVEKLVDNN